MVSRGTTAHERRPQYIYIYICIYIYIHLHVLFPTLQVGVVRILCQTRPPLTSRRSAPVPHDRQDYIWRRPKLPAGASVPPSLLQPLMTHRTTYGDGRSSQRAPVSRPPANSMQTLLQSLMTHRTTYGDGRTSQWPPVSRPPANAMQTQCKFNANAVQLQCKFNEISMQIQSDVNANSMQIQCKCSSTSMQIQ